MKIFEIFRFTHPRFRFQVHNTRVTLNKKKITKLLHNLSLNLILIILNYVPD